MDKQQEKNFINRPESECEWFPSPNFGPRPTPEISLIVIHNISLPPGKYGGGYIHRFFQNNLPEEDDEYFKKISSMQVSSHLLIERSGKLSQFVELGCRAWHAGVSSYLERENCNDFSIGIELEGCDYEAFTEEQYYALAQVCCVLIDRYPDINTDRITGHSDISPGRKTDPGPFFNWGYFYHILNKLLMVKTPIIDMR